MKVIGSLDDLVPQTCDETQMQNKRSLNKTGFTLIELLVVIAILDIIAAILLPVIVQDLSRVLQSSDLRNKMQLITAWMMYASDNNDVLVLNADQSVAVNGTPSWLSPSCHMDWTISSANTNISYLQTNQLGPYCAQGICSLCITGRQFFISCPDLGGDGEHFSPPFPECCHGCSGGRSSCHFHRNRWETAILTFHF